MLNDFLKNSQQRLQRSRMSSLAHETIEYDADNTNNMSNDLAFSNPEYMCFNELRTLMMSNKFKTNNTTNKSAKTTPLRKAHRPVPLPPPARPPPPPPCTRPPAIPPKLYQNIPILTEPIHVDCYSLPRPTQTTTQSVNLLKIDNEEDSELLNTFNNMTDSSCGSSMILLQSSTNQYNNSTAASDSSSATMIIKNSPEIAPAIIRPKQKLANHLLSPIMTSSRTNLQRSRDLSIHQQNFDDSMLFERNSTQPKCMYLTHSLPFKRTIHHQRQRRLSFDNETSLEPAQLQQTVENTQTNNTLTQKSFSNFNYELQYASKNQSLNQGNSFTASSSSLSGSSSLSSLILQPPSPFKTCAQLELPVQTPTKSNLKTNHVSNKQTKKVTIFTTEFEFIYKRTRLLIFNSYL